MAENDHGRLSCHVGNAQRLANQGAADALPLRIRMHRERRQPRDRRISQIAMAVQDVAHHSAVTFGNQI